MPTPKSNLIQLRRANTLAGGVARHRKGGDDGNRWLTPESIVEAVRAAFNGVIDLDPATEPSNPTGAIRHYTQLEDGLAQPWSRRIFLNPPYSPISPWIERSIEAEREGARIYLLVPVRTDAAYHHRLMTAATDVLFLRGRVRFRRADGTVAGSPAFASMIVGLGISVRRLRLDGVVYVPTQITQNAA